MSGETLRSPPVLDCIGNALELTLVEHRTEIPDVVSFTSRVYSVGGLEPNFTPPTIRMLAGEQCSITLVNDLHVDAPECDYHENGLHCMDRTNLHVHGAHVSPWEDDMGANVIPGARHTYVYQVPEDHLMGTHWYHAHSHGSTLLQLLGGAAGALLVDDNASLPADWAPLYDNAQVMLLQHVNFGDPLDDDAMFGDSHKHSIWAAHNEYEANGERVTIDPNVTGDNNTNIYVVNGQVQPVVNIQAETATLFRMVHTGIVVSLELDLGDNESQCTFAILSRDGVFQAQPLLQPELVVIPTGGRVDLAVSCPQSAVGTTATVRINPRDVHSQLGPLRFEQENLFQIHVEAGGSPVGFPTSDVPLPAYLDDLLDVEPHMAIPMSMAGDDTVNGRKFPGCADEGDPYEAGLCLGEVYDVHMQSVGMPAHPYHQHVTHYQIVHTPDTTGNLARVGEWRDSVHQLDGTIVRFMTKEYTGQIFLHCHHGQHSDGGLVGLYRVSSGNCTPCAGAHCGAGGTDTMCPQQGEWIETRPGEHLAIPCGAGLRGEKTRLCDENGWWRDINTDACDFAAAPAAVLKL